LDKNWSYKNPIKTRIIIAIILIPLGVFFGYYFIFIETKEYLKFKDNISVNVLEIKKLKYLPQIGDEPPNLNVVYTYVFNEKTYQSNRYSIYDRADDNFNKHTEKLYKKIKAYKNGKSSELLAYINPNNPGEAVIDISFRWSRFLFPFPFFIIGLFGGISAVLSAIKMTREKSL
tara:strand:- start:43 stop:564 length:522 start_codon:yes stop_codon:yes gene_type:complete